MKKCERVIIKEQENTSTYSAYKLILNIDFSSQQQLLYLVFKLPTNQVAQLVNLDSSVGKDSSCNAGDPGSIPGSGRSAGEGIGYPLQYSGLENSMYSTWGHKESDMTEQLSLSL